MPTRGAARKASRRAARSTPHAETSGCNFHGWRHLPLFPETPEEETDDARIVPTKGYHSTLLSRLADIVRDGGLRSGSQGSPKGVYFYREKRLTLARIEKRMRSGLYAKKPHVILRVEATHCRHTRRRDGTSKSEFVAPWPEGTVALTVRVTGLWYRPEHEPEVAEALG